jgi:hypothetical protein
MDAKQLVCAGKPPVPVCFPSCRYLVCAENPDNDEGVPGAGRGAAKAVGYGRARRAAVAGCRGRAIVRKCEPVLAYANGDTSCWSAGALRKRSGSMGGCPSQPDRVATDTDEQRKRRPLAQSDQVAAVPSRKLAGAPAANLRNHWETAQTRRIRQPLNGVPASRRNSLWRRFRRGEGVARRA